MKKINININKRTVRTIISCVAFTFVTIGFLAINGYNENYYTMNCEVIEIAEDDLIFIVDPTGNEWGVCADGFHLGDTVKATFFNNLTNNRGDDEVTNLIIN